MLNFIEMFIESDNQSELSEKKRMDFNRNERSKYREANQKKLENIISIIASTLSSLINR